MKISQLINEDFWLGNDRKGKARVRGDRFGWNGGEDPKNNSDVHIYVPGRQNKTKLAITEPRSESPVGSLHITKKDKRALKKAEFDEKFKRFKYKFNHSKLGLGSKIAATTAAVGGAAVIGKKLWDKHHTSKNVPLTHSDRAKAFMTNHGKKVAAGTLAALGAGIGVKALLKHLRKKKES